MTRGLGQRDFIGGAYAKPALSCGSMNTRMFWTPHAWWFGGGTDLNPCLEYEEDTAHFHDTLKSFLDPHDIALPRAKGLGG